MVLSTANVQDAHWKAYWSAGMRFDTLQVRKPAYWNAVDMQACILECKLESILE